jgi:REP element-mobilizing transposase RayT
MPSDIPALTPGNFYHIYNRGNNRQDVFIQERNYAYFMDLWWKHTSQTAETYAYCLLKNHFHATVYIKDEEALTGSGNPSVLKLKEPSQYFSNLFNAYTRAVNLATGRSGALFERPFERIPVTDEAYLLRLVVYIHQNPQKHKFVADFRDWPYSSYHDLVADTPTRLQREKLMGLFGGKQDFLRIHREIQPLEDLED